MLPSCQVGGTKKTSLRALRGTKPKLNIMQMNEVTNNNKQECLCAFTAKF